MGWASLAGVVIYVTYHFLYRQKVERFYLGIDLSDEALVERSLRVLVLRRGVLISSRTVERPARDGDVLKCCFQAAYRAGDQSEERIRTDS